MKEKKSFILYLDNAKQVNMLTDEQAGKFIKAVYKFAETGEETEFDDIALNIVYSFITDNIRRDEKKYSAKCEKNRLIALERENKKRESKNTTMHERAESSTNSTDNDNEIENENDIENENNNDIVNENENVNENEKIQQNFSLKNPSSSPSPEINSFIENFNNICKSFNSVSKISETDRQNIMEIIFNFSENEIIKAFEKIEKSSFLKGNKNNSDKYKDWKANFSWLVKYDHFLNAFNGNYDDNNSHSDNNFDINMYKQFINDFETI